MLNEHFLCCGRATLHPVKDYDISTGFDRKGNVIIWACATDFDKDRLFPIGDLAQFLNFNFQIIRAGPVRVATGRTLVYAFW